MDVKLLLSAFLIEALLLAYAEGLYMFTSSEMCV